MREGTGEDEKGDDISRGEKGDKREIWHGGSGGCVSIKIHLKTFVS